MTQGGPAQSTYVYGLYLYNTAFHMEKFGICVFTGMGIICHNHYYYYGDHENIKCLGILSGGCQVMGKHKKRVSGQCNHRNNFNITGISVFASSCLDVCTVLKNQQSSLQISKNYLIFQLPSAHMQMDGKVEDSLPIF